MAGGRALDPVAGGLLAAGLLAGGLVAASCSPIESAGFGRTHASNSVQVDVLAYDDTGAAPTTGVVLPLERARALPVDRLVAGDPTLAAAADWRCLQHQHRFATLREQDPAFVSLSDTHGVDENEVRRRLEEGDRAERIALGHEILARCGAGEDLVWHEARAGWIHLLWTITADVAEAEVEVRVLDSVDLVVEHGPGRSAAPIIDAPITSGEVRSDARRLVDGTVGVSAIHLDASTGVSGWIPLGATVRGLRADGEPFQVFHRLRVWMAPFERETPLVDVTDTSVVLDRAGRGVLTLFTREDRAVLTDVFASGTMRVRRPTSGNSASDGGDAHNEFATIEPFSWVDLDVWLDVDRFAPGSHLIPLTLRAVDDSGTGHNIDHQLVVEVPG